MKERTTWKNPTMKAHMTIKCTLQKQDWRVLTEFIWRKVVGPVDMVINFVSYYVGISLLGEKLLALQK
jgi:hypothetical protein